MDPKIVHKGINNYLKRKVLPVKNILFVLFSIIFDVTLCLHNLERFSKTVLSIMKLLSDIFKRKRGSSKVGGMEDYMTLIRVYFQSALASQLGINNLKMLPDLRTFKTTLRIPTVNNKLGVGEKVQCKKMLKEIYQTNDDFFKEIDQSIRKNCQKMEDVQTYLIQFQSFTQELMMLIGNLMKYKLRMPSFFKSAIYSMTEKTVSDIFNKNNYTDAGVMKSIVTVRQYDKRLGFSQKWISDFIFQVVILAKKEPKANTDEKP